MSRISRIMERADEARNSPSRAPRVRGKACYRSRTLRRYSILFDSDGMEKYGSLYRLMKNPTNSIKMGGYDELEGSLIVDVEEDDIPTFEAALAKHEISRKDVSRF